MRDELILNNLGLIYKAIKDLHCVIRTEEDFEEYFYAGLYGLIEASKTYDKELSNSKYLYQNIKNRIIGKFHMNTAKKRIPPQHIYFIENFDKKIPSYEFEEELINKIVVHTLLNKLKNKKYKKFIIEYYGIDTPSLTMQELAEKYGVTRQYIHQSIHRGLKLLREEIKNE